ncbi:MAG: copper homeostasis protein CutC [Paracoccus sp. (in: a-proteobacteria)]|uniref:copper homeostasis protein CutC n=1 Tax=Paracoccus sp. TaxID=267 RepID=UPI0039E22F4D
MTHLLEICVDDPAGLAAAIQGGAQRIELCAALSAGGLTPSPGLIRLARQAPVPVLAMIRPRAGGFVYDAAEMRAALDDIAAIREAGLAGIVTGASHPDGRLDLENLARLRDAATGLEVVLHRAFDMTPDLDQALDQAAGLGLTRIMTAGGNLSAPADPVRAIARLALRAAGRIQIMAGGRSVTPETAGPLLRAGADDLHAACAEILPDQPRTEVLGIPGRRPQTSAAQVARLRAAMDAAMGRDAG